MRRKHLNLLIKPTHNCNMDCEYCYDKIEKKTINNNFITLDIIQDIMKKVCNCYEDITIIWHGGEALLAGKDFFYKSHEIIANICYETNTKVNFLLQSNGILYEKNKDMLKKLNIKYSASLDYTNSNKYRKTSNIFETLKTSLESNKIPIINVFSLKDVDKLKNIYKYAAKNNIQISFNKIFLQKETDKEIIDFANKYNEYVEYVLFDKTANFIERSILNMIKSILNDNNLVCSFNECLEEFLSINPDGDIFICDRFGKSNSTKYGYININDIKENIGEFWETDVYKQIKKDNEYFKNKYCKKCKINFICKGCCKANRVAKNDEIDLTSENLSDCLFRQITFSYLFDRLYNLTENEMLNLNPMIYKMLIENIFINKYIIH